MKWLGLEESAEGLREPDSGYRICNSEEDQEHVAQTASGSVGNSRDEWHLTLKLALGPLGYPRSVGFWSLRLQSVSPGIQGNGPIEGFEYDMGEGERREYFRDVPVAYHASSSLRIDSTIWNWV